MPSEHLPEASPDHPARLRQELEGKTPDINTIADAIADQIRRIDRELKPAVPHAAETLWAAAHAIAVGLPRASNCALDAIHMGVRLAEIQLYAEPQRQNSQAAPGPSIREELIESLRTQRRTAAPRNRG